jgi:hypothetical protein
MPGNNQVDMFGQHRATPHGEVAFSNSNAKSCSYGDDSIVAAQFSEWDNPWQPEVYGAL